MSSPTVPAISFWRGFVLPIYSLRAAPPIRLSARSVAAGGEAARIFPHCKNAIGANPPSPEPPPLLPSLRRQPRFCRPWIKTSEENDLAQRSPIIRSRLMKIKSTAPRLRAPSRRWPDRHPWRRPSSSAGSARAGENRSAESRIRGSTDFIQRDKFACGSRIQAPPCDAPKSNNSAMN